MKNLIEQEIAEQATGCAENPHGLGKIYAGPINRQGRVTGGGEELNTLAERVDYLREDGSIAVPNAGAGSYHKVFVDALGFKDVYNFETSSSAGDWSFAVNDDGMWHPTFQSNRFPRCGFEYSVDFEVGFESKEDCFQWMQQ